MEVVYSRCCGLDVHKKKVTACVMVPEGQQVRSFGTMTRELEKMADWLASQGVTHLAMESTGVYWRPVYNLLEGRGLTLLVVNAQHIKAVPGRKTDVKDAEWIADLLRHGLLRGSVIPDRRWRELRELVRYRISLVRQRSQVVQRVQKVLEGANIKLSSVATDILGRSGREMLEGIIAGRYDPEALADLARGRLKQKRPELAEALRGLVGAHQRLLLESMLGNLDTLGGEIDRLSTEIAGRLHPYQDILDRLDTIPGVGRRAAEQLLAEIGPDVSRFPTPAHLASWAKVCPGNDRSAGKRKSASTGHGNPWLRSTLVEIAWAAARTRHTYLSAQYHRLAARRGSQRAVVAVGHSILVIVYHLLKEGGEYRGLGENYFDECARQEVVRRTVRRLERLGYKVSIEAA